MKLKLNFVTNSSSTAFFITNLSGVKKTLVDFVKENPQLIKDFVIEYDWHNKTEYNQKRLIKSAEKNNIKFKPGETLYCVFGDEQGTLVGAVFDYILREGGQSTSFRWKFAEFLR